MLNRHIVSCLTLSLTIPMAANAQVDSAKFVPNNGRVLFSIGQDVDSINNYQRQVAAPAGLELGGVVGYTGIQSLEGLTANDGGSAGRHNFAELAAAFPNSALIMGVSLNGDTASVANGSMDANITRLLDFLDSFNRPVFLRWAYEVEGPWNGHNPQQLVTGWRRVWDMIQARPTSRANIAVVWQVASYCGATDNYDAYYPGDEYVDWVGLSYFTPQDCGHQRVNKAAQFARDHQKPLFINESTPQRYDLTTLTYASNGANRGSGFSNKTPQQIWDEWYARYFQFMDEYSDVLRAITYINAPWDDQPRWRSGNDGYWGRSEVQAQTLIQENWLREIQATQFQHGGTDLLNILGFGASSPPADDTPPPADDTPPPADDTTPPADDTPPPADDAAFGIDSSGILYHRDNGWTANFAYLCINADCRSATRNGGRFERTVDVVPGATVTIEFKVQDNVVSQCFSGVQTLTYQAVGSRAESDCE